MSASHPVTAVASTNATLVIADTYPYCLVRSSPVKNIETKAVDSGMIIPAPIPSMALTKISCVMEEHTKYNAPLKRNRYNPMYNNLICPTLSLI